MIARDNPAVRRFAGQLGALLTVAALPVLAQNPASQIRAEIGRLQRSIQERPLSGPDFPDANSGVQQDLKAAADALNAGRIYLSVESVERAAEFLFAVRSYVERKAEIAKGGLPAFESLWGKESVDLTALEREYQAANWSGLPAAIQALAEVAETKTGPLLDGSRGFAAANGLEDGLYYLGEAEGEAGFARFCASLAMPRKAAPFPLRSFRAELQRLQTKTNAAFQPPRSIDLHARIIELNATLKLAQESDAAKLYAGALYEYLEATLDYGMLDAAPLDAGEQAALKKDLAAAHKKLRAAKDDHSLAQMFLERADSQTARADGSSPSADDWRSARIIVDQVLPAYFAAQTPASPLPQVAGKTVNITLVRWPYT